MAEDAGEAPENAPAPAAVPRKTKKVKKKKNKDKEGKDDGDQPKKKKHKAKRAAPVQPEGLSPAQQAVQEQMRRALEEDQYSATGSIVDVESDEEDDFTYRGQPVRLDRSALQQSVRKINVLERMGPNTTAVPAVEEEVEVEDEQDAAGGHNKQKGRKGGRKPGGRKKEVQQLLADMENKHTSTLSGGISSSKDPFMLEGDDDLERDGGSIFGATTGSSNSTWVECDKCKKWRRLRGVVDEKKLPSKWYCSMNKNDPERARCSAPEEEYETPHTPESAADARTRKHLRVWVRRLQCNEAYEARLPTLTRGKKRASSSSSGKDPYEWVRCCNPSCGKWRAILRIMDAKSSVIDRANNGEWYCVMNTWDEKTASCAAPQENLPAVGCPPWVLQDDK